MSNLGRYAPACRVDNSFAVPFKRNTESLAPFDSMQFDNDNIFAGPTTLTGTLGKTATSVTVTGTSTLFTTELAVGDWVVVPGTADELGRVATIASDTSLTVDVAFVNTATGQTAQKIPTSLTCNTDGLYALYGSITWNAPGTTSTAQGRIRLLKGATVLDGQSGSWGGSSTYILEGSCSGLEALNAGDTISLSLFEGATGVSLNATAIRLAILYASEIPA